MCEQFDLLEDDVKRATVIHLVNKGKFKKREEDSNDVFEVDDLKNFDNVPIFAFPKWWIGKCLKYIVMDLAKMIQRVIDVEEIVEQYKNKKVAAT